MEVKDMIVELEKKSKQFNDKFVELGEVDQKLSKEILDLQEKLTKKSEENEAEYKKAIEELKGEVIKLKEEGQKREQKSATFGDVFMKAWKENPEVVKRLIDEKKGAFELNLDVKAPMTFTASVTGEPSLDIRTEIAPLLRRKTHVRNLIPMGSTSKNAFRFVREGVQTGSANNQTEGADKAEITTTLVTVDANVEDIAGYTRVSTQMLDDIDGLASFLSVMLPDEILKKEDQQLLYGTGVSPQLPGLSLAATDLDAGVLGATVASPQNWDVLMRAAGYMRSIEADVNGILVNPSDYAEMVTAKGTDGQYVAPILFVGNQPTIDGIPLYQNSAVTAGDYFIGDWTKSQVLTRQGVGVRFFEQDQDNVIKNLITARGEERIAHAIYRPEAMGYGTFAAGISELTA